LLGKNERITVCEVSGEFNYSRLNNRGVAIAHGSLVVLLNNDIEIIDGGWLSEMVSQSLRSDVGAVGALLRYPDQTFQHAGIILGAGGVAGHAYSGTLPEEGYFSRAHLTQNLSAVTAACALIKRNAYLAIGGFDEVNVPVAFNDVDFCLRLRQAGFQIIWTPHAELYHHESASRGYEDTLEKQTRFLGEINYMYRKWGSVLQSDPFYNPNLSLGEYLFVPAFPPRLTKPWLTK
jgi:GT2 family glycosyltransferase